MPPTDHRALRVSGRTDRAEASVPPATKQARSDLRAVTLPVEHGGWGLTAEPIVLGLVVAPSVSGLCLGAAAVIAFLARTPLKVALVDRHRGRFLARTALARRVAAAEIALLLILVAIAGPRSDLWLWWPLLVMAPLVVVELWFDMRSRSRRLTPELCGAIGIAGIAPLILLVGGESTAVAIGAWLILAARSITAIVSVRNQVQLLHGKPGNSRLVIAADLVTVAVVALAVVVSVEVAAGAVAVALAIAVQRLLGLRPPPRAVILGIRQTILGLFVVAATAAGILMG